MIVSTTPRHVSGRLPTQLIRLEMRMERIERPFVRLLSLIAHHPDFITREDAPSEHEEWIHAATYVSSVWYYWKELTNTEIFSYILLYVDTVANANNIAYLHYLASRLKTVGDVAYPGDVCVGSMCARRCGQILTFYSVGL